MAIKIGTQYPLNVIEDDLVFTPNGFYNDTYLMNVSGSLQLLYEIFSNPADKRVLLDTVETENRISSVTTSGSRPQTMKVTMGWSRIDGKFSEKSLPISTFRARLEIEQQHGQPKIINIELTDDNIMSLIKQTQNV